MLCGTGGFKHVDEDQCGFGGGTASRRAGKKKPGKANPYAGRGLDKFAAVLSELESRREKVLERVGPDKSLVMVHFMRAEGRGWVPVVVKLPDQKQDAKKSKTASPPRPPPAEQASPKEDAKGVAKTTAAAAAATPAGKVRPSYYWLPVLVLVLVLVLVGVVVSGRVFAVCCASVGWYLVPSLSSCTNTRRSSMAKAKDLGKKVSDKKMGEKLVTPPPRSHAKKKSSCGALEMNSPRSHAHGSKG